MARKSYKRHRRSNRRGGNQAASASSYSDGSSYMMHTVGNGPTQYDNVFMSDKNPSSSNTIVGLQGQKAGSQRGGRRTKKRKGGYWGQVISQAIVPFSLLGLQQRYGRKHKGSTKKRRF